MARYRPLLLGLRNSGYFQAQSPFLMSSSQWNKTDGPWSCRKGLESKRELSRLACATLHLKQAP